MLARIPEAPSTLRTYAALDEVARAFADRKLSLMLLIGSPGLGKGFALKGALGSTPHGWIDCVASPVEIYREAHDHRNEPLVLDDIDGLEKMEDGVRLLKSLCETKQPKIVSWHRVSAHLRKLSIPKQFCTTSPVAIITNSWATSNAHVAAVEDRGHVFHFAPPIAEVHRQAMTWFSDQEILNFVADHLHLIDQPSQRIYFKAAERKDAGLDWKSYVLERCYSGTTLRVAQLKADSTFPSEEERVEAFVSSGAGCRATYFNHAKLLVQPTAVPRIELANNRPEPAKARPSQEDLIRSRLAHPHGASRMI